MPTFQLITSPQCPLDANLRSLLLRFFTDRDLVQLENLGGLFEVSITSPFQKPTENKPPTERGRHRSLPSSEAVVEITPTSRRNRTIYIPRAIFNTGLVKPGKLTVRINGDARFSTQGTLSPQGYLTGLAELFDRLHLREGARVLLRIKRSSTGYYLLIKDWSPEEESRSDQIETRITNTYYVLKTIRVGLPTMRRFGIEPGYVDISLESRPDFRLTGLLNANSQISGMRQLYGILDLRVGSILRFRVVTEGEYPQIVIMSPTESYDQGQLNSNVTISGQVHGSSSEYRERMVAEDRTAGNIPNRVEELAEAGEPPQSPRSAMTSEELKKQQELDFLNQKVFLPIIRSKINIPDHVREAVRRTCNRYHSGYPNAAALKEAFLADLRSESGRQLAAELERLSLPSFETVEKRFLNLCKLFKID